MVVVALDIETCPLPVEDISAPHTRRFEKELAREQERNPEYSDQEASKRVRSFHPYLGWVCCVSVVRGTLGSGHRDPHSWTASTPDEEESLLSEFWEGVGEVTAGVAKSRQELVWATFNGKEFDVPFLTARSAHHGLSPTNQDLLDSYPYGHKPHADLAKIWPSHYSLDDMCSHLGVSSPKEGIDGSDVAEAVADGRLNEVRSYCERDTVATFQCLSGVQWAL